MGKTINIFDWDRKKNWHKNNVVVNVGVMPYIYNGFSDTLSRIVGVDNYNDLPYELVHKKSNDREKAYVFYVLLSSVFYQKTVHEYNTKAVRDKLCKTFSISERSYYRYTKYLLSNGFAFIDKNKNDLLRLKSMNKICVEVNEKYSSHFNQYDIKIPSQLRNSATATIEIKNTNFDYAQTLLRFTYIKYDEEIKKRSIESNIKKSRKRFYNVGAKEKNISGGNKFVVLENNNVEGELTCSYNSKKFNDLYRYVYKRTRGEEATDLRVLYVMEKSSNSINRKELKKLKPNNYVRVELFNKTELVKEIHDQQSETDAVKKNRLLSKRQQIDKRLKSKYNDSLIEYKKLYEKELIEDHKDDLIWEVSALKSISSVEENISKHILKYNGIGEVVSGNRARISRSINPLNHSMNLGGLTKTSYWMTVGEVQYLNSISILSPYQYFKMINSDFNLSYRSGLLRISKIFGISKSQASRIIKKTEEYSISSITRRYVYVSSVNTSSPTELIKSMAVQYSMVYGKSVYEEQKSFKRLIYRHGNILYEIESNKDPIVGIKFNSKVTSIESGGLCNMNKYSNLSRKLYGVESKTIQSRYYGVFDNKKKTA